MKGGWGGGGGKWTKARGVDMKVAEGGVEVGRGFVLFGKCILA